MKSREVYPCEYVTLLSLSIFTLVRPRSTNIRSLTSYRFEKTERSIYIPGSSTIPVLMAAKLRVHHSGTLGKIVMARFIGPRLARPDAQLLEWALKSCQRKVTM